MSKKVLIIAAHPDDEVLGCGGTMARHVASGHEVVSVIMAEGLTSRDVKRDRGAHEAGLNELSEAAHRANKVLGVERLKLLDFPDNRMDSVDQLDINKTVERLIEEFLPNLLYTHHVGDVNVDHRRIHEAVVTACRPMPGKHRVETILFFETLSSTEWQPPGSAQPFLPDWYVDISDTLDKKLTALREYYMEMRAWPHARSIESAEYLARHRGSNIGVEAAEAFKLGRKLEL